MLIQLYRIERAYLLLVSFNIDTYFAVDTWYIEWTAEISFISFVTLI